MRISRRSIVSKGAGGDDEIYVYKNQTRWRFSAMYQIWMTINSIMDEKLVLQMIMDKAREVVGAEASTLMLLDQANGCADPPEATPSGSKPRPPRALVPPSCVHAGLRHLFRHVFVIVAASGLAVALFP